MDVNSKPKRILVVDDNRFERWQIALMCEEWGYEFAEAETAEAGNAKVRAFRPDVVVCDLTMGRSKVYFEGLRQIREAVGPAVPIVVDSGYALYEAAARQAGASEYVCKPNPERLRALLQPQA